MVEYNQKSVKGLLKKLRSALEDLSACESINLDHAYELTARKVRLPLADIPLQLMLGRPPQVLQLAPEPRFRADGTTRASGDYLIFDPKHYFDEIAGFIRLHPGETLDLGGNDPEAQALLGLARRMSRNHLRIRRKTDGLLFKRLDTDARTCLAPLVGKRYHGQLSAWRRRHLERLAGILPGPIGPLKKGPALQLIEQVVDLLDHEPLRPTDADGHPGGIVELPAKIVPIVVGDLHAQVDNLLVVLTQNGFLDGLIAGRAALVLLGDAVHPEEDGHLDEMETSMAMMDLIFRLKVHFPERIFYLRGNHDTFSDENAKQGVPQGLLWRQHLRKQRGPAYVEAMERVYERLPYLVVSTDFLACHAGAPTRKTNREALVNIRRHPKLRHELTHNRLQRPNRPAGYSNRDIKRLRERLGLSADAPFIVGHTPLGGDESVWAEPGGVSNHFVVYSGGAGQIGVMTRVNGRMVPLRYLSEPLVKVFNRYVAG